MSVSNSRKRVLVTGGLGFIGGHVVNALLGDGCIVDIVDDHSARVINSELKIVNCSDVIAQDFTCPTVLDGIAGGRWSAIFHLAARPRVQFSIDDPLAAFDVNVTKTLRLLQAIKESSQRPRLIFSSSSSVYGNSRSIPTDEFAEINPVSPYALQKRVVEEHLSLYSKLWGVESVVLRYFNVYGPGVDDTSSYATAVSSWKSSLSRGEAIRFEGDGSQRRDLVHVTDVARANVCAMKVNPDFARGHEFNIGSGRSVSNIQILEEIKKHVKQVDVQNLPARQNDVRETLADISTAQSLLGWDPQVTFSDGIANLFSGAKC